MGLSWEGIAQEFPHIYSKYLRWCDILLHHHRGEHHHIIQIFFNLWKYPHWVPFLLSSIASSSTKLPFSTCWNCLLLLPSFSWQGFEFHVLYHYHYIFRSIKGVVWWSLRFLYEWRRKRLFHHLSKVILSLHSSFNLYPRVLIHHLHFCKYAFMIICPRLGISI